MSDHAKNLRSTRADMLGTDDEQHYVDCQNAADEIERLTAERDQYQLAWVQRTESWRGQRTALEKIVNYEREDDVPEMHMWDIAREALKDD